MTQISRLYLEVDLATVNIIFYSEACTFFFPLNFWYLTSELFVASHSK